MRAVLTQEAGVPVGPNTLTVNFMQADGSMSTTVPSGRQAGTALYCATVILDSNWNSGWHGSWDWGDPGSVLCTDPDRTGRRTNTVDLSYHAEGFTAFFPYKTDGTYAFSASVWTDGGTNLTYSTNITIDASTRTLRAVGASGSDTNTGATNQPWATWNHAITSLADNEELIVSNGFTDSTSANTAISGRTNVLVRMQDGFTTNARVTSTATTANSLLQMLNSVMVVVQDIEFVAGSGNASTEYDTGAEVARTAVAIQQENILCASLDCIVDSHGTAGGQAFGEGLRIQATAGNTPNGPRGCVHINGQRHTSNGFHCQAQPFKYEHTQYCGFIGCSCDSSYFENPIRGLWTSTESNDWRNPGFLLLWTQITHTNSVVGSADGKGVRTAATHGGSVIDNFFITPIASFTETLGSLANTETDGCLWEGNYIEHTPIYNSGGAVNWGKNTDGITFRHNYVVAGDSHGGNPRQLGVIGWDLDTSSWIKTDNLSVFHNTWVYRTATVLGAGDALDAMPILAGASNQYSGSNIRWAGNLLVYSTNESLLDACLSFGSFSATNSIARCQDNIYPDSNRIPTIAEDAGGEHDSATNWMDHLAVASNELRVTYGADALIANNGVPVASEPTNWLSHGSPDTTGLYMHRDYARNEWEQDTNTRSVGAFDGSVES